VLAPAWHFKLVYLMTDADYNRNIQRFRRAHWLHYGAQALLMAAAGLATHRGVAGPAAVNPQLATWPALLALAVAVPLLSVVLYGVCQSIRPNLRRPYAENMRIYLSRLIVRNSLLGLLGLPLLAAYLLTHQAAVLAIYAGLLLFLGQRTAPSAKTYQRWLLT
jgi:hypothetical protein